MENDLYTKLENPTRKDYEGLRYHTELQKPVYILHKTYTLRVEVADKGCFVGGHRRSFQIVKKLGTLNLGGLRGGSEEVITWAPTESEVIRKAITILTKREAQNEKD